MISPFGTLKRAISDMRPEHRLAAKRSVFGTQSLLWRLKAMRRWARPLARRRLPFRPGPRGLWRLGRPRRLPAPPSPFTSV